MQESILKIEHLSHRYNIQWAVRDISFEIPKRGIYGLLGSNGAGKSTTMNIISGVIKQTEGSIFIKGVDARKSSIDAKRHIGFLPQKPPLYGDLTVEEFTLFSPLALGFKSRTKVIRRRGLIPLWYYPFPKTFNKKSFRGIPTTCGDCTSHNP